MTPQQIREKIDNNNALILDTLDFTKFVLNNDISKLMKENKQLQEQCVHYFKDKKCIWCDKEED